MAELEQVRWFLLERLVQHEQEEEAAVYPVVAKLMGGEDPMGTMARAHMEIEHLARVFGHLLSDLPPEGPGPEDLVDLRRVLYGLHAILRLHFAQEEEAYCVARRRRRGEGARRRGLISFDEPLRRRANACRAGTP